MAPLRAVARSKRRPLVPQLATRTTRDVQLRAWATPHTLEVHLRRSAPVTAYGAAVSVCQRRRFPLPLSTQVQICQGLKKLHDSSIVHRALKARNLLLFAEPLFADPVFKYRYKLTDLATPHRYTHPTSLTTSLTAPLATPLTTPLTTPPTTPLTKPLATPLYQV